MSDDHKLVKQDIVTAGGVLAYTRGQVIRADAAKQNGWGDYVVGRDTQEAKDILTEITGPAPDEPKQQSRPASTSAASTKE